jgi:hypothetical protein
MKKTEYEKLYRELPAQDKYKYSEQILSVAKTHINTYNKEKLKVIWIETNDSQCIA